MREPVFLYTADLHFTNRRSDEYRWDIFKHLATIIKKCNVTDLFILGDLTDQKDRHPSELVSKLNGAILSMSRLGVDVWILKGNHDYVQPLLPFFKFLDSLPRVHYFTSPENVTIKGVNFRFLPHTEHPVWLRSDFAGIDRILMHQPIVNSVLANGWNLEGGMSVDVFSEFTGEIISGDIHVPQKLGKVRYVGAPYPIHFGDTYTPRVLLERAGKLTSIKIPAIKKLIITVNSKNKGSVFNNISSGDQVKAVVKLRRPEFPSWRQHKDDVVKSIMDRGGIVQGIELQESFDGRKVTEALTGIAGALYEDTPAQSEEALFKRFILENEIDKAMEKVGREILNAVK